MGLLETDLNLLGGDGEGDLDLKEKLLDCSYLREEMGGLCIYGPSI